MKKTVLALGLTISFAALGLQTTAAQGEISPRPITPTPTPRLSATLAKNFEQHKTDVPRERREQAYAKLLEGQRYVWNMNRLRSQALARANALLARQAFQKALELDPTLSEGYTALAELVFNTPPIDMEEAISLSTIAVKINPDGFGAHRILARVYTAKSRLNNGVLEPAATQKAISEWKEVARLDPRNTEAWAFLSQFYEQTNKSNELIDALKMWLASAAPIETNARFYRLIMGTGEDLSPESASLKLGSALIKANRASEAVEILSRAVSDDPENAEAINLLKQAVGSGDGAASVATQEALQQAIFANPNNLALVELLAQIQSRAGKTDDAVKSLRSSIAKLLDTDKNSAASLQLSLGDIYAEANRYNEAIAGYEEALKILGIEKTPLTTDDEREFAMRVFGKMIEVYKSAGRINEAKATIQRARTLLGREDLFADRQLISLLRETGEKQDALQTVRALRARAKGDYSLIRLEASLLTDLGKVDEGIVLIKTLIGGGKTLSAPILMYDDFSNYVFISSLYIQARRGKEAIETAQKAYAVADTVEKKQIANLSLASAQQASGDFRAAEETLRSLLKQTPGNPIALNNLGYFLLERNEKIDEAINLIQQAVKIDPTNPSYLDSLGWAYFKLGKLSEAEVYLREAIRGDSTSATIYEHLGDVYQKQGKNELAKTAWQKAASFSNNSEDSNRIKSKLAKKGF